MARMQEKLSSFVQPRTLFDGEARSNRAEEEYEDDEEDDSSPVERRTGELPYEKTPGGRADNQAGERSKPHRSRHTVNSHLDDPYYEQRWKYPDAYAKKLIRYHPDANEDFSKPYRPIASAGKSKFTRRIAEAKPSENPKIPPTMGQYDGLLDPDDHLHTYIIVGIVSGWKIPVWCHIFTLTLVGAAKAWV